MTKGIALLLSAFAGMLGAMQPPINSKLGHAAGTFAAATISFLVGTAVLFVVALASGGAQLGGRGRGPGGDLAGGLIGAVFVASSLVTVRTLGAAGVVAATIAGQLTGSVIIDRFGLPGLSKQPLTVARVVGIAFLAVGVFLVVRK